MSIYNEGNFMSYQINSARPEVTIIKEQLEITNKTHYLSRAILIVSTLILIKRG